MMDCLSARTDTAHWELVMRGCRELKYEERRKYLKKMKRKLRRRAAAVEDASDDAGDEEDARSLIGHKFHVAPTLSVLKSDPQFSIDSPQQTNEVSLHEKPSTVGSEDTGNTGNTGNDGNTSNTGNSGNTGNTGNDGNTSNTGNSGNTECSPQSSAVPNTQSPDETKEKEISSFLESLDSEIEQWHNPYSTDGGNIPGDAPDAVDGSKEAIPAQTQLNLVAPDPHNANPENREACYFYGRVGSCRFGDNCSKFHEKSSVSRTLLFPAMFRPFAFDIAARASRSNIHGDANDLSLEHTDEDLYEEFIEFYDDIFPEFQKFGTVDRLNVCCNRDQHLRGNVYVQFSTSAQAETAFLNFNGRFYGGRMLQCGYVAIPSWSAAICGLHSTGRRCPRGGHCNFLHLFVPKRSLNNGRVDKRRRFSREKSSSRWSCRSSSHVSPRRDRKKRRKSPRTPIEVESPVYSPIRSQKSTKKKHKKHKKHNKKKLCKEPSLKHKQKKHKRAKSP